MHITKGQSLELYTLAKRLLHYAACLETECANLGDTALADPRNVTLNDARKTLSAIDGNIRCLR